MRAVAAMTRGPLNPGIHSVIRHSELILVSGFVIRISPSAEL